MFERQERLAHALSRRLGWVSCALEAVHHRHNVSAVLRTCESMGIQRVDLVQGHFQPARGPTKGAERWIDIERHDSADEAVARIRSAGFSIWVADLADPAVSPETVPLDRPICLWFGAELVGVSPVARAAADGVITIPMHGLSQSLNVSVAAALAIRPVAERARLELGERALLDPHQRERVWAEWMSREEATKTGASNRVQAQRGE